MDAEDAYHAPCDDCQGAGRVPRVELELETHVDFEPSVGDGRFRVLIQEGKVVVPVDSLRTCREWDIRFITERLAFELDREARAQEAARNVRAALDQGLIDPSELLALEARLREKGIIR